MTTLLSVLATGLLAGGLQPAAPTLSDARWLPWLGCWQLWEEQLDPSAAEALAETAALLDRTLVCVEPTADGGGVDLTASAGERVLVERALVADGARRDVQQSDCDGWEQSAWSADGQRLFTRAEIRCSGQPARRVSGVSLMTSAATWADIQVIEVGGRELVEVRRYAPLRPAEQDARLGADALGADPAAINRARRRAAAPLGLPAVIDASRRTSARAVEALLVETEPTLPLDSAALIALDDAGISGRVTDLLVALAWPAHFVVERRERGGGWASGGWRGFGGFHDPIWYDSYYPYYVTPLGYHFWSRGYYDPYLYGGFATPFVVLPGGGGDSRVEGQAVPGVGFTRVTPRGVTGPGGAAPTGSSVAARGGRGGGGSSGGAASPGGFSGGGSSSSGGSGRTAVPRR